MHKTKIFVAAAICFLSSGCARYRALPLPKLGNPCSTHRIDTEDIRFAYKVYDANDCQQFLGRNVLKKGYQPIQLTINNSTGRYLKFSARSISFPCVPPFEIAKKVETSTVSRVLGWGIPGLFIWPFLIPAVVDGIGSEKANQMLNFDYATKFARSQIIEPFSTLNGLIFVPLESFNPVFTVTLVDQETNEKIAFSSARQIKG